MTTITLCMGLYTLGIFLWHLQLIVDTSGNFANHDHWVLYLNDKRITTFLDPLVPSHFKYEKLSVLKQIQGVKYPEINFRSKNMYLFVNGAIVWATSVSFTQTRRGLYICNEEFIINHILYSDLKAFNMLLYPLLIGNGHWVFIIFDNTKVLDYLLNPNLYSDDFEFEDLAIRFKFVMQTENLN